jgi:Putative bacterial sensory transduction regulator
MPDRAAVERARSNVEQLLDAAGVDFAYDDEHEAHVALDAARNGALIAVVPNDEPVDDDLTLIRCFTPLVADVGEVDARAWRALCELNDRIPLVKFTYARGTRRISAQAEWLAQAMTRLQLVSALRVLWYVADELAPELARDFGGRPVALWRARAEANTTKEAP